MEYMKNKGLNPAGKDIMITNTYSGLTASACCTAPDSQQNPTHNTAIKIMNLAADLWRKMREDERVEKLKKLLAGGGIKAFDSFVS